MGIDDLLGIVLFGEGTCRAGYDTLTAGNAGHFAERHLKCAADLGIETAVVCADDGDVLLLQAATQRRHRMHFALSLSRCRVL